MIGRLRAALKAGTLRGMEQADLALVLAFDGSASVTYEEFNLIVGGTAAALRSPEIAAGLVGSLAAVVLWSGRFAQLVTIDWTGLSARTHVAAFADAIDDMSRQVTPGTTAIGEALVFCERLLARAPAASRRQVIDLAGDGRSNDGTPPGPVRDRLTDAGVTINGLCVLHEEPDLLDSYTREVIGGPGAFALVCPDYAGFAEAMAQKLRREIA